MGAEAIGTLTLIRISDESDVDLRTVAKFLAGKTCKRGSRARGRIIQTMRRMGLEAHIPRPGIAKAG